MKKRLLVFLLFIAILITGIVGLISKPLLIDAGKEDYVENVYKYSEVSEIINEQAEIKLEKTVTNLNLIAVGDIMFHLPQISAAKTGLDSYDFNPVFKHVKKYIENADVAVGNLETVIAGNELKFSGFPRFNSPKETISALKNAGFDILSTANNHSLDRGKKGIINTIDTIEEYGLENIGTFKDEERSIFIEDKNGIRLGFIAYTFSVNGLDSLLSGDEGYMINNLDEVLIKSDIMRAKDLGADLVVVYVHWGYEYHREPSQYQVELGRKMVEWGANIVLGSHPHNIQRAEVIEYEGKDNLIIYSMGNFLSNQSYETMGNSYTEDGVMIEIEIEKDVLTDNTIIKNIDYIPTWVYRYNDINGMNYEILPAEEVIKGNIQIPLTELKMGRLEKSFIDTLNTINTDNEVGKLQENYDYNKMD